MPDTDTVHRKVLFISNLFHASPRIPRLLKDLPSLGWSPTVITPRIEGSMEKIFNAPPTDLAKRGVKVVEIGNARLYENIKNTIPISGYRELIKKTVGRIDQGADSRLNRVIDRYYWRLYLMFNFPDVEKGWKTDAMIAAEKVISEEKFDLVLSSSSPVITHIICSGIKKKFRLPWIAEYRDLWTLNHNYQLGPIMHYFDKRLETKTMSTADALVTVNDTLADELRGMFPQKNVLSIPTGFDREEAPERISLTKTFTITYTGQFYRDKQDPRKILDAISELIAERKMDRSRVQIRFYGPADDALQKYSEQVGLEGVVIQYGVIPRKESLLRQKDSQVLLFMNWEDPKQKGGTSLKFVEYLSAGRPILLTGDVKDNILAKIVDQTSSGDIVASKSETKAALEKYYREYLASGTVSFYGKPDEIEKFDFKRSATKYADLMNSVVEKGS